MNRAILVITTYGSRDENKETLKFFNWALSDRISSLLKDKYDMLPLPHPMGNPLYNTLRGKGKAIRDAFSDLRERHGVSGTNENDIIIYMDGNQIDYEKSLDMIELIKSGKSPFVMTCRINGMGIDDERGVIERFENYLISYRYGLPWIPDIQCGCWAFRGDFFDEIVSSFQSNEFEIELELMNFFLKKGIFPAFIGMDVGKPDDTSFLRKDSEPKLIKLSYWLQLNKEKIYLLAEEFQKKYKLMLPTKYFPLFERLELFNEKSPDNVQPWKEWKGIICICSHKCPNEEKKNIYHPCNEKFKFT